MKVCDHCRDLKKPVLDLRLMLLKPDPDNNRKNPEELACRSVELCQECSKVVWGKLSDSITQILSVD